MPEPISISFENGMDQSQDASMLGEGSAALVENWVPEPTGGLRCRRGWLNASTTGAPATRKTKSLGFFQIAREVETPARVQAAQAIAAANNASATWGGTTTTGNLLVLIVSYQLTSNLGTITVPSGWVLAHSSATGTTGGGVINPDVGTRIYYKANAAAESGGVSATVVGSSRTSVQIAEYSGIEPTSPLDKVAGTTGLSTTPSTGTTATTEQNKEVWIGAVIDYAEEAMSAPTNSFSIVQQHGSSSDITAGMLERITTSIGAASSSVTTTSSNKWAGAIATFKARTIIAAEYLVAAHDNTTSYDLYHKSLSDITSGTWTSIESVSVPSTSHPLAFAVGLGQLLYTNAQLSTIRRWDGSAANAITSGPPGRTIQFHKNRFFSGGTDTNPTRLWYSDLGSYTSWPATSYIDINQDDGEPILDLAVFEEGLLIAKENSLWFLSGSGPNDFTVHQLNAGGGFLGRCIGISPFGAIIAGQRQVWLWAGGGVELVSKPVEESYSLEGDYVSVAYLDGIMYICDQGSTTMFCLDMQRGTWRLEKTGTSSNGPQFVTAKAATLYYGPKESDTRSLAVYREIPGSTRQRDATLAETFKAYTPEIWPVDPGHGYTPQRLYVKFRQRGGDASDAGIVVTTYADGAAQATTQTIEARAAAGTYRDVLQVTHGKKGISSNQFRFEHAATTNDEAMFDIEEVIFEYDHVHRLPR